MTKNPPEPNRLDEVAMVRGASTGFTVLILGELLAPLAAQLNTTLGLLWVSMVGAAGFVVAGSRIGVASNPWLQGAITALAAFLLTVPLRLLVGIDSGAGWYRLAVSAVFSIIVGAIAGRGAGLARSRSQQT
ncbi:hypothetical protein [Nocardioides sp.]|uniref:hypothetical protein n=1 Tax=Nocardioides sp. TaxID=35761 RepID=UPI00238BF277|nr:hypothetical protein [Nocardioides sp.]MDE0775873.1 hypothetical protein [Nocardioides sp.]